MNTWFTSDTHFGHANIIGYANRPFASADEMDEALIANWNAVVKMGDQVYHLGDVSWHHPEKTREIIRRLKGQKFLVYGNHDRRLRGHVALAGLWAWEKDLTEIVVDGQRIVLCHYAMRVWNCSHHGAWQLYGHSHGSLPEDSGSLSMDVGVDPNGYTPISVAKVAERMSRKSFVPVDRHGA